MVERTSHSVNVCAQQMLCDHAFHSNDLEELPGEVLSKSGNPFLPARTVRSDLFEPLPEDTQQEKNFVVLSSVNDLNTSIQHVADSAQPEQELSYLTQDLPDYESEESSFCLPDPLHLQKLTNSRPPQKEEIDASDVEEVSELASEDIYESHGASDVAPEDSTGYRADNSTCIEASNNIDRHDDEDSGEESGLYTVASVRESSSASADPPAGVSGWARRMAARKASGSKRSDRSSSDLFVQQTRRSSGNVLGRFAGRT
jgi:hypothetical protein